ncbi:hypothetical protein K438DRAFT_1791652 [Mycena galopus ATCC 62051]|nr:hypothetical protein K438DRAFT_1791652 [Mycena galopus ATCC 62051]
MIQWHQRRAWVSGGGSRCVRSGVRRVGLGDASRRYFLTSFDRYDTATSILRHALLREPELNLPPADRTRSSPSTPSYSACPCPCPSPPRAAAAPARKDLGYTKKLRQFATCRSRYDAGDARPRADSTRALRVPVRVVRAVDGHLEPARGTARARNVSVSVQASSFPSRALLRELALISHPHRAYTALAVPRRRHPTASFSPCLCLCPCPCPDLRLHALQQPLAARKDTHKSCVVSGPAVTGTAQAAHGHERTEREQRALRVPAQAVDGHLERAGDGERVRGAVPGSGGAQSEPRARWRWGTSTGGARPGVPGAPGDGTRRRHCSRNAMMTGIRGFVVFAGALENGGWIQLWVAGAAPARRQRRGSLPLRVRLPAAVSCGAPSPSQSTSAPSFFVLGLGIRAGAGPKIDMRQPPTLPGSTRIMSSDASRTTTVYRSLRTTGRAVWRGPAASARRSRGGGEDDVEGVAQGGRAYGE